METASHDDPSSNAMNTDAHTMNGDAGETKQIPPSSVPLETARPPATTTTTPPPPRAIDTIGSPAPPSKKPFAPLLPNNNATTATSLPPGTETQEPQPLVANDQPAAAFHPGALLGDSEAAPPLPLLRGVTPPYAAALAAAAQKSANNDRKHLEGRGNLLPPTRESKGNGAANPAPLNSFSASTNSSRIRLLVCTGNLGNTQPDVASIEAWLPKDGRCKEVIREDPPYPLVDSLDVVQSSSRSALSTAEQLARLPASYGSRFGGLLSRQISSVRLVKYDDEDEDETEGEEEATKIYSTQSLPPVTATPVSEFDDVDQFDLIVIGMQEATFDPPPSTVHKKRSRKKMAVESESGTPTNAKKDTKEKDKEAESNVVEEEDDDDDDDDGSEVRIYLPIVEPLVRRTAETLQKTAGTIQKTAGTIQKTAGTAIQKTAGTLQKTAETAAGTLTKTAGTIHKTATGTITGTAAKIARLTATRDHTKTGADGNPLAILNIAKHDWGGGTHALHRLLEARLPSYERIVSYQRGQMRLEVFSRIEDDLLDIEVLHTSAQNTGMGGLANKGGIVTELLINGYTRLSFVTAHLEAHEGAAKCQTRIKSLADILSGTKAAKWHDVSMTSHYSFVMGDLNFRTDLENESLSPDEHKKEIMDMVSSENWKGLNGADELHRILHDKKALVGYHTPACNFPPTFKLQVKAGYEYQDKRRPSYTDRVLWKSAEGLENYLLPRIYEPIDDFATSDHKPMRAAFEVPLNAPLRLRPQIVRNDRAVMHLFKKPSKVGKALTRGGEPMPAKRSPPPPSSKKNLRTESVELFISNIACEIYDKEGIAPNPYLALVSAPYEILRSSKPGRFSRLRRNLCFWMDHDPHTKWKRHITNPTNTEKKKHKQHENHHGWPTTSRRYATYQPSWHDEEIECSIDLHRPDGSPVDLTGAMLHLTLLSFNTAMDDSSLGTFTLNLANVLRQCREQANRMAAPKRPKAASTPKKKRFQGVGKNVMHMLAAAKQHKQSNTTTPPSTTSTNPENADKTPVIPPSRTETVSPIGAKQSNAPVVADDPIVAYEIDSKLLKNGREVGHITCQLEAWWLNEKTSILFHKEAGSATSQRPRATAPFPLGTKPQEAVVKGVNTLLATATLGKASIRATPKAKRNVERRSNIQPIFDESYTINEGDEAKMAYL